MDARKVRKDSALRRQLWRAFGITAVVGVALLLGFDYWLRYLASQGAAHPERVQWQLSLAAALINVALIAVAVLLARCLLDWGRQAREQGQWPPAGLEWPGQAPLRHGADALRIAKQFKFAGIAAVALAAVLAGISVWRWLG